MTAKWQPSDDELDGLARAIAPPELATDQAEHLRTSILASAANARQLPRSSRTPIIVAVGAVVAAAAAVLVWFNTRGAEPPKPRADVVALDSASFEHEQPWPSYLLRVDSGRVQIDVATVDSTQQFTTTTSDSRIDVRASKFTVGVEQKRIASIDVQEGRVELTYSGRTIILAAGQTWHPPVRTAETDVIEPPAPVVDKAPVEPAPTPTKKPAPPKRQPATDQPSTPTKPTDAQPLAPKPGELDFRAGVALLRGGDAVAATKAFASACTAARKDALAEDACFWVGAAAKRAGQTSAAREALTRFLQGFASSARAGEASALLGWLLYDANELDAAETRFNKAAADRVPKVRTSAERGLEAIKRRRAK
ncbi:MAG: hypothetical protein M4D80_15665 [Myxococcota bacterium]|nr:hypothetical protein [Deltaproteobacteria bacterium]MDQ3336604.1 hypothetical protein [Myxococcota bacterium]